MKVLSLHLPRKTEENHDKSETTHPAETRYHYANLYCNVKKHTMKTYGEEELQLPAFLTSAHDRGEGQLDASAALPSGKDRSLGLPIG